jgi:hypothetical protein
MDALFSTKPEAYVRSAGAALNVAVNQLADVYPIFFLNRVAEDADDDD